MLPVSGSHVPGKQNVSLGMGFGVFEKQRVLLQMPGSRHGLLVLHGVPKGFVTAVMLPVALLHT